MVSDSLDSRLWTSLYPSSPQASWESTSPGKSSIIFIANFVLCKLSASFWWVICYCFHEKQGFLILWLKPLLCNVSVVPCCRRWYQTQRWSLLESTRQQWSGERREGHRPPWQEAHHRWSWCLAVYRKEEFHVSGYWSPQSQWSTVNGTNRCISVVSLRNSPCPSLVQLSPHRCTQRNWQNPR